MLKRMPATRIVAKPAALSAASWPADALVLRIAQDEVLIFPPVDPVELADEHAIVVTDTGFAGVWLAKRAADAVLERVCDWKPPKARPAFAQGAIAGIPAKVWFEVDRVLFLVPAAYTHDFEERAA